MFKCQFQYLLHQEIQSSACSPFNKIINKEPFKAINEKERTTIKLELNDDFTVKIKKNLKKDITFCYGSCFSIIISLQSLPMLQIRLKNEWKNKCLHSKKLLGIIIKFI